MASGIDGIFYRLPDPFCKRERQVASRPAAGSAPVAGWFIWWWVCLAGGWWRAPLARRARFKQRPRSLALSVEVFEAVSLPASCVLSFSGSGASARARAAWPLCERDMTGAAPVVTADRILGAKRKEQQPRREGSQEGEGRGGSERRTVRWSRTANFIFIPVIPDRERQGARARL